MTTLTIVTEAEAARLVQSLVNAGIDADLIQKRPGVGNLQYVTVLGGREDKIQISESHRPTEATGSGVRECTECGTRWKSVYGELMDSAELNRLGTQGGISVYASRDTAMGLTCIGCRRSVCLQHLGQSLPVSGLGEHHLPCPSCARPLYWA